MTIEQQEYNLDKRIRLFEQSLEIQMIALSLSEIFNPKYQFGISMLLSAINQLYIIKSQTMHKYESGGLPQYS